MTGTKRRSGNPARPAKPVYRPTVWHRHHRWGLAGIVAATGLTLLAGFLGPSAVTITLGPRRSLLPSWYLPAGLIHPNEWLLSVLRWAAIVVGAIGLWVALRALADGWKPRVRRIFGLGVVLTLLTICVPPLTSADVLMYAAYGRLQALGANPYDITPAEVVRSQFDPVMEWIEYPWHDTPSVYGPITSWTQLAANRLGGENMHDIVFWLQVCAAVPFIVVGAGAVLLAHGDQRRQARAALLTVANPLLIWAVVAGAHNEALAVMFAVAGMLFMRKSPFVAGLGIGLAGCAKLSIGLWGLAMLWAYRREPKKALALCAGTAIPMGLAYVVWQPSAFFQVLRNGSYVSVGSWAHPVFQFFNLFLPDNVAKVAVGVLSYGGLVVIAWMLSKTIPWSAVPGLPKGADLRHDPLTIALRTALVLSVAWLVTAMYTLSWYDLMAWVPLAVLATGKLDRIMLVRNAPLALAYVPGRAIEYGPALDITAARIRDTLSPAIQFAVLLALVLWWRQPDRPELFPFRRPAAGERQESRAPGFATEGADTPRERSKPSGAAGGERGSKAGVKRDARAGNGGVTGRRPRTPARSGPRRR